MLQCVCADKDAIFFFFVYNWSQSTAADRIIVIKYEKAERF